MAAHLVGLAVRVDDLVGRARGQARRGAQQFVSVCLRLHAGERGQPGRDGTVALRRGGRAEDEGIGEDAAEQYPGEGARRLQIVDAAVLRQRVEVLPTGSTTNGIGVAVDGLARR